MKKEYTTKIHVERIKRMMKRRSPCEYCPATPYFTANENPEEFWSNDIMDICTICREFIGLTYTFVFSEGCPCKVLEPEKALKRTRKALEEWEGTVKRREE